MYSSGLSGFAGALPSSLSFINLTTGNAQTLRIGDRWVIEAHGNGNAAVEVTGSRDGRPFNFGAMGVTDDSGVFRLEGSALPDQAGQWVEQWKVGGALVGVLSFSILAPSVAPPAVSRAAVTPPGLLPAAGFTMPDVPLWAWGAAAAGALFLFSRGR